MRRITVRHAPLLADSSLAREMIVKRATSYAVDTVLLPQKVKSHTRARRHFATTKYLTYYKITVRRIFCVYVFHVLKINAETIIVFCTFCITSFRGLVLQLCNCIRTKVNYSIVYLNIEF